MFQKDLSRMVIPEVFQKTTLVCIEKGEKAQFMREEKGFTLLELVLVILVLGIGISGVAIYFTQTAYDSSRGQLTATAVILAQDINEEIRAKCWDETSTTALPCNGPVIASLPLAPEGEGRATFDDIDDFNGLNNNPPQDSQGMPMAAFPVYTRSAAVCYVNSGALNSCVGGPTPFKRVTATVSWGSAGDQVQIISVFSNRS